MCVVFAFVCKCMAPHYKKRSNDFLSRTFISETKVLDSRRRATNKQQCVHTHSFHIQLASNSPIVYIYFLFYLNIRSEKQIVDIFFPLHFDSDGECWFVDVDLAIENRFITYTRDIYRGFALYKNAHAYVSSLSLCAIKRQPKVFIFMRLNLNTKTQK